MATSKVTAYFRCPAERVWRTVTDLAHTAWRSDLKRVEVLDETHFVEHSKSGYAIKFTVTACVPFGRWALTMENGNRSGSWKGVFEAVADGGTRLHCTETVNAKRWWMRPFVPGYLKRQQKRYLDDLRKELLK